MRRLRATGGRRAPPRQQNSLGSGVIVASDGLIVTNHHVVEDADQIMVVLNDRREFAARVVGEDEAADLALLRIDAEGDLPAMPMGESDDLLVGDLVLKTVAQRMGVVLRRGEIRARYGGDEFVAVVEYARKNDIPRTISHRLIEELSIPMTFDGATVGGTVATDAAGAATFKYGTTRAWVRRLTVVLANGDVLDIERGQVTASDELGDALETALAHVGPALVHVRSDVALV